MKMKSQKSKFMNSHESKQNMNEMLIQSKMPNFQIHI